MSPAVKADVCSRCGGTGWREIAAPADGAAGRVAPCSCRRDQRAERLLEQANIPARYRHCALEDFDPRPYDAAPEGLYLALAAAKGFVEKYPGDQGGLLLLGPCGVGKTHLAVGIIRKLMEERGAVCRFADYRDLLKRIQATFDPQNPRTEESVVRPLLDAEVLALDDLGVGRPTEWSLETVHYLLNHRYSHELPTIITSNLSDAEGGGGGAGLTLADGARFEPKLSLGAVIGERLRSRLYEMCQPVVIDGRDFRREIHGRGRGFR